MALKSVESDSIYKNGGVVSISEEMMHQVLDLAPEVHIRGIEYKWDRRTYDIYLTTPAIQVTTFAPASSLVIGVGTPIGMGAVKQWKVTEHRGFRGGKFKLHPVPEGQCFPMIDVLFNVNHRRKRVYQAIDGEREYQDNRWGPEHDEKESLGNFLLYIEKYLFRAKANFSCTNEISTLHEVRKIAALAVAAMERFGAPQR